MAITHPTTVRNAITDAVVDLVDAGSGAGYIELTTAGDVEVATLALQDPAFGSASGGSASALSPPFEDSSATGGTATKVKVKDSDDNVVYQGTVGLTGSGADVELTSNVIAAGSIVRFTAATYTAPV